MEVYFQGNTMEYLNTEEQVDGLFEQLNHTLKQQKRFISSMRIDNIDVYDNYKAIILERLQEIQSIEVISVTLLQMADETLNSVNVYLIRVFKEMNSLIDELYQGAGTETWVRFSQFLEGIQWVISAIQGIKEIEIHYTRETYLNDNINHLQTYFPQLADSLENQDVILTADILNFEIIPILQKISEEIKFIIISEVVHHDH